MGTLSIEMYDEQDQQDYELMKFECWYWSVVDDVANLIVTNGYNNIMMDIEQAIDRIKQNKDNK
jgi:hypothetical protein